MPEYRELTISDAVHQMQTGELTAQALLESCLDRIHRRDDTVRAWVEVYKAQAFEQARQCDQAYRDGKWLGDLHGIPLGVKDIIDVKGMWTRAGCAAYEPRKAKSDAPAVKRLRRAGAIILGKTETTAFANNDPTVTRNPWNTEHTPGGSSSGSGAAVADRMCLAALGTQTGGSVLRPAAYNGIVGFKPAYDAISIQGVVPVSRTLDHVGIHARSVKDTELIFGLMRNDQHNPAAVKPGKRSDSAPFRFGCFKKFIEEKAEPSMVEHFNSTCEQLKQAGAVLVELDLADAFAWAANAHRVIFDAEQAAYHRTLFSRIKDRYPPNLKARIENGMTILACDYLDAMDKRIAFKKKLSAVLAGVDAAILPTAPSTAPRGLESTGSPVFCVPWSISGFPAITIPTGLDGRGLSRALQLGAVPMAHERLFAAAAWCEGLFGFDFSPESTTTR
jgi:aspartyl-tRNA(Asn)/glutamyl-tRNA(Gln) amidotransferase subunit A